MIFKYACIYAKQLSQTEIIIILLKSWLRHEPKLWKKKKVSKQ